MKQEPSDGTARVPFSRSGRRGQGDEGKIAPKDTVLRETRLPLSQAWERGLGGEGVEDEGVEAPPRTR
jgi:hypothetical protein